MSKAKPGVSLLLILIFLAGLLAPVPECFVTRVLCPRARTVACSAPAAKAPPRHSSVAACCAKPQKLQAAQPRHQLSELRSWMKPYEPEREIVEAPALPTGLLASPFCQTIPPDVSPFALNTLSPGNVPEPIPILLGKESFLI